MIHSKFGSLHKNVVWNGRFASPLPKWQGPVCGLGRASLQLTSLAGSCCKLSSRIIPTDSLYYLSFGEPIETITLLNTSLLDSNSCLKICTLPHPLPIHTHQVFFLHKDLKPSLLLRPANPCELPCALGSGCHRGRLTRLPAQSRRRWQKVWAVGFCFLLGFWVFSFRFVFVFVFGFGFTWNDLVEETSRWCTRPAMSLSTRAPGCGAARLAGFGEDKYHRGYDHHLYGYEWRRWVRWLKLIRLSSSRFSHFSSPFCTSRLK